MKILINGQLKNVPDVMFGSGHEDTADVSDNIESRFINDCNYCDSSQLQPISKDSVSRCKRYMELERLSYRAVTLEHQVLLGVPNEEKIEFSQEYAPFRPENLYTWQEAAKLGIPDGCYLFGKCLLNGGEAEEGLCWLKIVASKGHKHAKRTLGEYLMDNGEPDEGLRLLQEASDAVEQLVQIAASRAELGGLV